LKKKSNQSAKANFLQMATWIGTELMSGRAHTEIMRGLLRTDISVRRIAPKFFEMTIDAHAETSMQVINRIFDRRLDCITIPVLLNVAVAQSDTFRKGSRQQVLLLVSDCNSQIKAIEAPLEALRLRRNETGAHAAHRPLVDPESYIREGTVTHRDIDAVFDVTDKILTSLLKLYGATPPAWRLPRERDFEGLLAALQPPA
jgi:hypothetical protein